MNIKYKLSLLFTLIGAVIILVFSLWIYYFSANYRTVSFYNRLLERAKTTARLLLDVKEVDDRLFRIINNNTFGLFKEHLYVFNPHDSIVFSNDNHKMAHQDYILTQIRKEKLFYYKDIDFELVGIVYVKNGQDYISIASAYDKYGYSKLENLRLVLIFGYLIALVLTSASGIFFAGRTLIPISKVINEVKGIGFTNLHIRVDEGNKRDEIARLAITFNEMLQRIEEALILQNEFISNASHELRTPFTVMHAELELCLLQDRSTEEYKNHMQNIIKDLKRLSLLTDSLLLLAQINNKSGFQEFSYHRVDEIVMDARFEFSHSCDLNKIKIRFHNLPGDDTLLQIFAHYQLLKTALKNIIENAIKFSAQQDIYLDLKINNQFIEIDVTDEGIGIPQADLNNIFKPFYRGDNTQFIGGHGLGLALTKKIIDLHNGTIRITSELGRGTKVNIILPRPENF